jgi:hypothetical protein
MTLYGHVSQRYKGRSNTKKEQEIMKNYETKIHR